MKGGERSGISSALLAILIAAAALAFQHRRFDDPHVLYDRFTLPGFDSHVYVAMADHPAFFTVAPWGYRVLTPWLVAALPVRNVARGFRIVTLGALVLAGVALYAYLRRLGFVQAAALAGVLAFGFAGPVGEAVKYRFLAEPLTVLIEILFLLALEAGAGLGVLALLAVMGALSKEFFLLLLPLVFLLRLERDGGRKALASTLIVAAPALAVTLALRWVWAPQIASPLPRLGTDLVVLAWRRVSETWPEWWASLLLFGLTPLALFGAVRKRARPRLAAWGYLVAIALLPPLFNPVAFLPGDPPRLLIYALPAVIPLALLGFDNVWRVAARPPAPRPPLRPLEAAAAALAVLFVALPLFAVDRYRRVDLQGPRDGPLVLAVCRETLRTASRLERGLAVSLDPETRHFVWGESDPGQLDRMRWFLREGWGPLPHYGVGPVVMRSGSASILLPVFSPQPLELRLSLDVAGSPDVSLPGLDPDPVGPPVIVSVNGRRLGSVPAGAESSLEVPAAVLFRGDNRLMLSAGDGRGGTRLRQLSLRTLGSARAARTGGT